MTLALAAQWAGGILALLGAAFMIVGAVGLLRMPDVFTRLHAASVSDTLGVGLILVGLMLYGGFTLVTVKLVFIALFLGVTGPVATHAVARAALQAGVRPKAADGTPIEAPEPAAPPPQKEAAPSKPS